MGFVLVLVVLPDWQEHVLGGVGVCAVGQGAPAREPLDQALAGRPVTTAALTIHQVL
jgi:hypothetical protein